jgi:hypothetical protein
VARRKTSTKTTKKTAKKEPSGPLSLLTIKHWQVTDIARLIKQTKVKTTELEIGDVIVDYENDHLYQVADVTQKGSAWDVRDCQGNGAIAQASTEFIILDRKCLVKGYKEPMLEDV